MDDVVTTVPHPSFDAAETGQRIARSGVGGWLYQLLLYPGDFVLSLIVGYTPQLAAALGLSPEDFGGGLSALLSVSIWTALLASIRSVRSACRNAMHSFVESLRILRIAVRARIHLPGELMRSVSRRFTPDLPAEDGAAQSKIRLNALDLAVLTAEARLAPGFSLTAPEIAESLKVRPSQVQHALDKLKKLQLITDSFSSMDGFDAYQITDSGRFVVTSRGLVRTNRSRSAGRHSRPPQ